MNFVEPIRDLKKIAQIKNTLRGESNFRDLLLFELGINSALRISDLLNIKANDLFDEQGHPKEFFEIKEDKTNKISRITLTPKVKETLKHYKAAYPKVVETQDAFIFFHKKYSPLGNRAIGRKQAWVMISKWCKGAGISGNFGGHTLRKTWGYQARQKAIPLEIIQHKLNHSSLAITQRYLGITADEIAEACNKLDL
jgi:integrase